MLEWISSGGKMVKTVEQKISSIVMVARVFALVSIVCAHIGFTSNVPYIIAKLYSAVASIGVICYLICSAYYYNPKKYTLIGLLKNKAKSIGLPWLFLGTVGYLYNGVLSKSLSLISYLRWMVGNGTYLYFLTILILCFLIFYRTNKIVLYCAIGVNIISLILTALGILGPVISALHITNYLNIFNWVGVFALGMLAKQVSEEKLYNFLYKSRFITLALFAITVILVCIFDIKTGYFSYIGIWFELLGTLAILGASTIRVFENKLFYDISNLSFTIYLIHMMVIGIFDRLYNLNFVLQAAAVFIIIGICYGILFVGRCIIKLIKLEKHLYPLFGFRNRTIEKKEQQ